MKFLKKLMTNDLTKRTRIEQLEIYYMRFFVAIRKSLGDQIHTAEFLDEQFDFYVDKDYPNLKKDFWKNYVHKINMYQRVF